MHTHAQTQLQTYKHTYAVTHRRTHIHALSLPRKQKPHAQRAHSLSTL
jgi:hypothetical protein